MIDHTRILLSRLVQKHGNATQLAVQAILQAILPKNALIAQVISQFLQVLCTVESSSQKELLTRIVAPLKEDSTYFPQIVALISARFESIIAHLVQMEKMGVGIEGLNSLAAKHLKESQEPLIKQAYEALSKLGGQLKQTTDQVPQSAADFAHNETPSTQFSPQADDGNPKVGDVIGDSDWTLLELLGKGGMGSVWKAKNAFDQVGALKLMLPHLLSNDKLIQRFRLEILSLMKVKHPNIVSLLNWGRDRSHGKDRWYFVTDFIEGKSLAKVLQESSPLDLEIVKNIFLKLADGLAVAHEQGVIHRDIKPGNIMIKGNFDPVLIDFGIAKQLEDTNLSQTQTHERVLTIQFASPEQLYGEPVSERSDVFSLAATMMFVLHPDVKRQRPRFEPNLVPEPFHYLLERSLNYQLENRPANMKEFAEILNKTIFSNGKVVSFPQKNSELQEAMQAQAQAEQEIGQQVNPSLVNVPVAAKLQATPNPIKLSTAQSQSPQSPQNQSSIQPALQPKPSLNTSPVAITAASMPLISFDEQYHYLDPNGQQKKATLIEIIESIKAMPKARHMVWKKGWPEWQSWHKVDAFKNYLQAQKESQTQQFSTQNMVPFSKMALDAKGVTISMICLPPGSFWMGNQNPDAESDEKPRHKVVLTKGFLLSETQITQDFFECVTSYNPSLYKYPNHPVERVSWLDAVRFCNQLSEMYHLRPVYEFKDGSDELLYHLDNDGYRLPTEAEWEYAAKAGTQFTYSGSNRPDEVAWFGSSRKKEGQKTFPVKEKQPNGWGFYDMSGNVWEWCTDDMRIYQRDDVIDPIGDLNSTQKVSKGGSNYLDARQTRCSYRIRYPQTTRSNFVGFRLAKNII